MAETQIFYIVTSDKDNITGSGQVTGYAWGSYGKWTKFKNPTPNSNKAVKYSKTAKSKAGKSKYGGVGGTTKWGTSIPATATRTIEGVPTTVDVRYYQRGYTIIKKTRAMTTSKKMQKTVYTASKPYQYRLQYKDKVKHEKAYSQYKDGTGLYIYFADHYYNDNGTRVNTSGHLPHPQEVSFSFADVRKNLELNANNNETRDNKGKFILRSVRPNVLTISLKWQGLSGEEGSDLLSVLNPGKGDKYLIVQYLDPIKRKWKNGTFYADARSVTKFHNGIFKEISVTLTEV